MARLGQITFVALGLIGVQACELEDGVDEDAVGRGGEGTLGPHISVGEE